MRSQGGGEVGGFRKETDRLSSSTDLFPIFPLLPQRIALLPSALSQPLLVPLCV